MPSWDPRQYLAFAGPRLRPALDLLAQVPLERPSMVYDLGCGPGNSTHLLAQRWPQANIVGVDSSPDMLATARAAAPAITFVEADIAAWMPPRPPDLLFSNATLHWLGDHDRLFPRLVRQLAPGGVLAVQMPHNHDSPSHLLIRKAADSGPWRAKLAHVRGIHPVAAPEAYYRMLAPHARSLDIWESDYLHVLEGDDPVVEWNKGTALRPYLDALDPPDRDAFLTDYAARVAAACPKEPDGRTLFLFRRLFIVAAV
jgi:trans-aconitate 2-methyltransferase